MIAGHVWLDGWGVLVWLASAAFWILVIAGIVALVRGHGGSGGPAGGSALRLLEERYARGEISREEFFERRSTLTSPPSTPPSPPPEQHAGERTVPGSSQREGSEQETRPLGPQT
jgi:putative membrane protein